MKNFSKTLLIVVLVILLGLAGLVGWLSMTEYIPDPIEELEPICYQSETTLLPQSTLDLLSWNIGYAGLGAEQDFIMDGGQTVRPGDENTVSRYLRGIQETLQSGNYDMVLLQEVDVDCDRTYSTDEAMRLASGNSYYAPNYVCPFVPNPETILYDPIGKVNSGLLTKANFRIDSAERISLPCPFDWPLRIVNLKRCLLVSYLPIEGSEQKLVLVNLHLEAYDSGEGKIAQTKQLRDFIESEYQKGNYVIAGGDFNQLFPRSLEHYPIILPDLWQPGVLEDSQLPDEPGWLFVSDNRVPSCRLLNQPYDPADTVNTQYYVIDGFIISPNVQLEMVETLNLGFTNSDHNPVHLRISLR